MAKIRLLLRVESKERELELPLKRGKQLMVGRDGDWLAVNHPSVSRKHFYIEYDGAAISIWDNASTNGTFVDGELPSGVKVKAGDTVLFGDCAMQVLKIELNTKDGVELEPSRDRSSDFRSMKKVPLFDDVPESRAPKPQPNDFGRDLETLLAHPKSLIAFFQHALLHPLDLIDSFSFKTPWKFSLGVVSATIGFNLLFHPWFFRTVGPSLTFAIGAFFLSALTAVGWAGVCHYLRGTVRMKGDFSSYLAFGALYGLMVVPLNLIAFLSQPLWMLIAFYVGCVQLYGFYRVFRPVPGRALATLFLVGAVPGALSGIVICLLALTMAANRAKLDALQEVALKSEVVDLSATETPSTKPKQPRRETSTLLNGTSLAVTSMAPGSTMCKSLQNGLQDKFELLSIAEHEKIQAAIQDLNREVAEESQLADSIVPNGKALSGGAVLLRRQYAECLSDFMTRVKN